MNKEDQRGRTGAKEEYAKKVWDEFDDFFEFTEQVGGDVVRDETKGTDYKANVEINFMDSYNGVK